MPDFQLTFMRCFTQFLFPAIYFCYRRRLPTVKRQHWLWLFLYCFFVNVFNFTNYMAVNYIAAGVASAIRRSVKVFLFNFHILGNVQTCSVGDPPWIRSWPQPSSPYRDSLALAILLAPPHMFKPFHLDLTKHGPPSWNQLESRRLAFD